MNNLKIATRLQVAFALLTALLIGVAGLALWQMGVMRASSQDLATDWLPSVEQVNGVKRVGEAVGQTDQATQQNAALVEPGAAAAESLKGQAQQLVQAVPVFKLAPQDGPPAATYHAASASRAAPSAEPRSVSASASAFGSVASPATAASTTTTTTTATATATATGLRSLHGATMPPRPLSGAKPATTPARASESTQVASAPAVAGNDIWVSF